MAYVHVCRHGEDLDNKEGLLNGHRDRDLSPRGVQQAATVAEAVRASGVKYRALYCSPLRRARQTAEAISTAIQLPVRVYDELIERDFGILTGKPVGAIRDYAGDKVMQGDRVLYFLAVPGAETFDVLLARAQRVLAYMDAHHPGEHVLLVCHGDIGKMLQAARAGMTWQEGLKQPYLANTAIVSL